ncbi:MAG: hypothetical protein U9N50_12465 [Pseudomonadota bacterium]|nr:hypothetical protein [Pseudomonadota bacterium]
MAEKKVRRILFIWNKSRISFLSAVRGYYPASNALQLAARFHSPQSLALHPYLFIPFQFSRNLLFFNKYSIANALQLAFILLPAGQAAGVGLLCCSFGGLHALYDISNVLFMGLAYGWVIFFFILFLELIRVFRPLGVGWFLFFCVREYG